jgi:hypothetical protein
MSWLWLAPQVQSLADIVRRLLDVVLVVVSALLVVVLFCVCIARAFLEVVFGLFDVVFVFGLAIGNCLGLSASA